MSDAARPLAVEQAEAARSSAALARNASFLVVGQIATTALALVLTAALGRTLGAIDFGRFFLLTSMSTFAYVLVDLGQGAWVIREVARHPARSGALLGTVVALRAAGGVAAAALTAGCARLLGYDAATSGYAALMVVALLPLSLSQAYGLVFRGLERMDHDALVSVLAKAFAVAFTVAALALGGRLLAAILGQAAGGAGALAVAVLLLARQRVRPAAPAAGTAGELVAAGAPLLAMNLLIAVQPYLDAVLLSKLAAPTAVGWFGAAKYVMGTLLAPAAILGAAAYPRLSRAASDLPALRRELRAAMRPLLGLGALGAAGTFLFADLAVSIVYGEAGYGPTATLLRVFAPALPLFYVDWLLTYVLLAAGEARRFAVAKLVAVAVGALLELLLIPAFEARLGNGGVAVVLAFGASELVVLAAALWLVPRGALDRGLLLDAGRAAVAGGAAILAARALPAAPPLVLVPLCLGAFALAAAGVGLVDRASLLPAWRALRRGAGAEVPP